MNENILVLNDLNTGNNIKQGDRTILKYLCDDGNGDKLDLTGLPARAVLKTRKNQVVYQTEAQISDRNEVTFIIDRVVPANQYVLEIVVDNQYIFPSDNSIYLNVTKSSIGSVDDFIQNNSREYLEEIIDERINGVGGIATVEYVDGSIKGYLTIDELKDVYLKDVASVKYVDSKVSGLASKEYVDSLDISEQLVDYATTEYVDNKVTGLASTEYVDSAVSSIDLSDYATTGYVDGKVGEIDLTPFATKEELNNIDLTPFATKDDLTPLATTEYVDNKVSSIDLSPYSTTEYVDNKVNSIDLSPYATTEYIHANFAERSDLESLASTNYVDDKVTGLATTEYVDSLDISNQLASYATKADLNNIQLTDEQKAELKGEPFRYEDFTEDQLNSLRPKIWTGKYEDFIQISQPDPTTLYLIKE